MSKFKVGDKVRIVKPFYVDREYINDIVTITEVEPNDSSCYRYKVKENDRPWVDDELEYLSTSTNIKATDIRIDDSGVNVSVDSLYPYIINYGTLKDENKEENEMRNEVLELWYRRKGDNVFDKYEKLMDDYINKNYSIVSDYKKLIEDFSENLEYLFNECNKESLLIQSNAYNQYKYVIDTDAVRSKAIEYFEKDKDKELEELQNKYQEIKALLSMSNDLSYQQDILIEYGIIDKKTKRMIIDEDNTK